MSREVPYGGRVCWGVGTDGIHPAKEGGEERAPEYSSPEPAAAEAEAGEERAGFDAGQKLKIDREPKEKCEPL